MSRADESGGRVVWMSQVEGEGGWLTNKRPPTDHVI